MNKYTGLSDFEINKKVAELIGATPYPFGSTEYHRSAVCGMENAIIIKSPKKVGSFDPCNNPADAMPIIIENNIDLLNGENMMPELFGHHSAYTLHNFNTQIASDSLKEDKTIYRLGMEVFLMKKDAESNQ